MDKIRKVNNYNHS